MSNLIVAAEGFDIYPDGTLSTFPWRNQGPSAGSISSGSGAFTGNKGLTFNAGTAWNLSYLYSIVNGGVFQHAGVAPTNKMLIGFNAWIRIDNVVATLNPQQLIGLASSTNLSQYFPILGLYNTSASGLNLLFPTSSGSFSTSSKMMAIQTSQYYWLSIRFAVDTTTILADYYVNGVPVYTSIPLTYTSDPLGTNTVDSLAFWGYMTGGAQYTIDDMVFQMSNGSLSSWPAGSTSGNPNPAILTSIPVITPRRIYTTPLNANGSINQWTPSVTSDQNWQDVSSSTNFVESSNPGDVDLYKLNVDPTIQNPIAICNRFATNKYLNAEPVTRESSVATVTQNPGVVNKGAGGIISIQETAPSGTAWSVSSLKNAEFGEQSL